MSPKFLLFSEPERMYDPIKVSKLKYIPLSLLIVFVLYESMSIIGYGWNDLIMCIVESIILLLLMFNTFIILILPGLVIDYFKTKTSEIVNYSVYLSLIDDDCSYSSIVKHAYRWNIFYYNWFNLPELIIMIAYYCDICILTDLYVDILLTAIRTHTLINLLIPNIYIIIFLFSFVFNMVYYAKLLNNLNRIQKELVIQDININDINLRLENTNEPKIQLKHTRFFHYMEYDDQLKTFIKLSEMLKSYYLIFPFNIIICIAILLYFNMFITLFVGMCIIIYNNIIK